VEPQLGVKQGELLRGNCGGTVGCTAVRVD